MSGRLVILPHKSWNVWNATNKNKVLRDERLEREAAQHTAQIERANTQELTLSTLRNTAQSSSTSHPPSSTSSITEPFSLFPETRIAHNPEYMKEKAEAAMKQSIRDGTASTPLVDKSILQTWYTQKPQDSSLMRQSDDKKRSRDESMKSLLDPMKGVMRDYSANASFAAITPACGVAIDSEDRPEKKRRHKKHHKHSIDRHSSTHATGQTPTPTPTYSNFSTSNRVQVSSSSINIDALRARRIEREKGERRKAEILKASASSQGSYTYGKR